MADGVKVKIYYIPSSHPCEAVFKAAEIKGIDYQRVVVLPPLQVPAMTLLFGGRTVPAMKITGGPNGTEKVQTSRKIMRTLESIQPEPPLYPQDAAQRERVTAAEAWADGDFQDAARRILWLHLKNRPDLLMSFAAGSKLPLPEFAIKPSIKPAIWIERKINSSTEDQVRRDLEALPGWLDQVDEYIADGVIGGAEPNAADLLVFASIWLYRSMEDLRVVIDERPCGRHSRELFGEPIGSIPAGTLPAQWFTALNASRGATAPA